MEPTAEVNEAPDGRRSGELDLLVRSTERRLVGQAALFEGFRLLPYCGGAWVVACLLFRFDVLSLGPTLGIVLAPAAVFLVLVVRKARAARGLLRAALLLDRSHDLQGRLTTTWEYSHRRGAEDDAALGFVRIVQADLRERGPFSARRAAPFGLPRGWGWALVPLGLLGVALFVPLPRPKPPLSASTSSPAVDSRDQWVSEDDSELLRRQARTLAAEMQSEEGQAAAERFNEIVLKVASGELTRNEAFRLAAELQAELDGAAGEAEALKRGLARRGQSLAGRRLTQKAGEALTEGRFEDAAEALQKLSERLESGDRGLSAEELDELRQALEEARETTEKNDSESEQDAASQDAERQALEKRRNELKKKEQNGKATAAERSERKELDRQLKKLGRRKEKERPKGAQKTLSELDKQLAEAARALAEQQQKSGQFLQQAARTVSQAGKKTLSDEEKKELLRQLKEMKERLRRQNEQGNRQKRMRDFQRRARGQQQGQGGDQKGQQQGGARAGQPRLTLGPDGIPIPGSGKGQKPGQGQGPGEGDSTAQGQEPGNEHHAQVAGEKTELPGAQLNDALAVAQDSGQGQSESETIRTAAEEGFTRQSYAKLFRQYETVAEEVMENEDVPPGRKAHVQRYFELIRPREDAPLPQKEK